MSNAAVSTETQNVWNVRNLDECPEVTLEGFKMYRILDGAGFANMGCEYVVIEPYKVLEPHFHRKGHAVILVISGNGFVSVGDEKYPLKENTLINIPPGTEHGLEAGSESLVVYGFQSPAIIDDNDDADIFFSRDNRKGIVYR
ncbi:MAG: hypothetical protein COA42_21535 [Alteromonadaceae bacterium]|nr:MAG: hypothetical protein COA42_21535 [Alteromonadaceae bacterium]